jgi:hypothetical protein
MSVVASVRPTPTVGLGTAVDDEPRGLTQKVGPLLE